MSCGSGTVAHLHVVVAWGVVKGVGQAPNMFALFTVTSPVRVFADSAVAVLLG
jgi:hypothetical protein